MLFASQIIRFHLFSSWLSLLFMLCQSFYGTGGGAHSNYQHKQQKQSNGTQPSASAGKIVVPVLAGQDHLIFDQLLKQYDQRVRPPKAFGSNDTAVLVSVNILVRMLSKIDVVNMEYSLQITFREQWTDSRLAYGHLMGMSSAKQSPKFLTVPHVKAKIWFPDTFFPTEKSAHRHMLDTENMFVRIFPNGTVLYSQLGQFVF